MAARVTAKSEVNITPFVDVMLVLLLVFMAAAPLATKRLELALPTGDYFGSRPPPVFVSLHNGAIWVGTRPGGERRGDWRSFAALVQAAAHGNRTIQVYVRADHDVAYGDVVRLIDELHATGYSDVSIISEDIID